MLTKIFLWSTIVIILLYTAVLTLIYFYQEKLLFYPEKLPLDYEYEYDAPFKEMNFKMDDNIVLNGLLFKTDFPKGLVFYLHGNAGSLATWGSASTPFTTNNYDCFLLDYRGYGKSGGRIMSEQQLHKDISHVYSELLKLYEEKEVIIVGYSLGTGLAANLAANNRPKKLILQAPYNSLTYMLNLHYPLIPAFALRYPIPTGQFLKKVMAPITLFHGKEDLLIPIDCSFQLQKGLKKEDRLIVLANQDHHFMSENRQYLSEIKKILNPL